MSPRSARHSVPRPPRPPRSPSKRSVATRSVVRSVASVLTFTGAAVAVTGSLSDPSQTQASELTAATAQPIELPALDDTYASYAAPSRTVGDSVKLAATSKATDRKV